MLQKIYGEIDTEGQRRYSPATCIGCETKVSSVSFSYPRSSALIGGQVAFKAHVVFLFVTCLPTLTTGKVEV